MSVVKLLGFKEGIRLARATGSGDYASQIEICEGQLERDPKNFAALAQLARCYDQIGKPDLSIELANRALEELPANFAMLIHAAKYWARSEDAARAYHFCCRAVESGPDQIELPGWVSLAFRLISILPKYRDLERRMVEDQQRSKKRDETDYRWALGYKLVYESRLESEQG